MHNVSTNKDLINAYLHYGYLPPAEIPPFLFELDQKSDLDYSVTGVSRLLDKVFEESLRAYNNIGTCVVPVSGGWDSRILLGMALEHFPADRVRTYTFGSPGQLDYEIGRKIAKVAGVEHTAVNLKNIELSWEDLIASVKRSPWTYVPDSFFNMYCYHSVAINSDLILSGFMGDPLTGGHQYLDDSNSITEIFAKSQAITKSKITSFNYSPEHSLPSISSNGILSKHQLYDLGVRQAHCITRIISTKKMWDEWGYTLGQINGTDADLITPFAMKEWIQYWVQAPESEKKDRKLYLELLNARFPKLANAPSKDYYGAKTASGTGFRFRKKMYHGNILLHRYFPFIFDEPPHMKNYLNYSTAFRNRDDYKNILDRAISYLKEKELTPWLDFGKYRNEHRDKTSDHSKLFLLLIGLALNVSANGLKSVEGI